MSSSAHGGNHDQAYFEAAIEETFEVTVTSAGLVQVPTDVEGALLPGRYLVQVVGLAANQTCWLHVGKFAKGAPLAPSSPTGGGPKRFPLTNAVLGIETHCLGGYSDRMAAQLNTGGSATLLVSRVSTEVRKSNRRA